MAKPHSKDARAFSDIYDLSGSGVALTPTAQRVLPDGTAFGDAGRKQGPAGPSEDIWTLDGLFDSAADGIDKVLSDLLGSEKVVSLFPAGAAVGDIGLARDAMIGSNYRIKSVPAELVQVAVEVSFNGQGERVKSLTPKVTKTATFNGTSIDDSASSSSGGSWYYHIIAFSATGGNARWQIVLQDSANDSSFATVSSESVNITATTAARRAFSGTLRRYVRVRLVLDASSGSLEFQASYLRS